MLYPIELRAQPNLAERRGFEPPDRFYPINRLAGGCLQPARPPLRTIRGGGSRIRTHGALRLSGFQDRRLKPLGHPSAERRVYRANESSGFRGGRQVGANRRPESLAEPDESLRRDARRGTEPRPVDTRTGPSAGRCLSLPANAAGT